MSYLAKEGLLLFSICNMKSAILSTGAHSGLRGTEFRLNINHADNLYLFNSGLSLLQVDPYVLLSTSRSRNAWSQETHHRLLGLLTFSLNQYQVILLLKYVAHLSNKYQ
jgi:hypothetical protein